jgi:threonine synthase
MTDADPSALYCRTCDTYYGPGPDEPWRCTCGAPLDFDTQPLPGGDPPPFSQLDTRRGLWTFFEFLPVEKRVSLGEGFTPLVGAPDWNAQFKLEYVLPTGSFKDRGATTTISRALELGVDRVLEDSSGNAGASIATYAARAGLEADIYVPSAVKQSKLMAIQRAGARPVRIDGSRADVTDACHEAVENGEGWYASHAWNPAFLAGTMTFAFEVAAQRNWSVPDTVVVPVGHGTLLLGAYRGFVALYEADIVDTLPRLIAAQATGYAPIADQFDPEPATDESEAQQADVESVFDDESLPGDETVNSAAEIESMLGGRGEEEHSETGSESNEIAEAIHITNPARREQLVDAIETTGGTAIAVGENALEFTLDDLHRSGFYVEPTCAIAPAALQICRERGIVSATEDVVVPLTGSGMKTM